MARVREQIAESRELQDALAASLGEARTACSGARIAHDEQVDATLARLREVEDYESQLARTERATSQAAHATDKAQRAEADRAEKRQPYEADKLFSYLWVRRYRFPEYRALPLVRSLDAWVADYNLCD